MDWTFLKPSISKIIICIILFVLIVPFIYYDTGIRCIQAPCPSTATGSLIKYLSSSNHTIEKIEYDSVIIGLVIEYLVACMIIFGFKKLKRN